MFIHSANTLHMHIGSQAHVHNTMLMFTKAEMYTVGAPEFKKKNP